MRTRSPWMLAVAAVAALAAPSAADAKSIRAPHCSVKGSKTIAANSRVRVFKTSADLPYVYGCRRNADRAYELGVVGECQNYDEIKDAVVAGNLVALHTRTCGLDSSDDFVRLVSLRTGKALFVARPLSTTPADDDNEYDVVGRLVLTPGGRVAWTGVRMRGVSVVQVEVRRRSHGSHSGAVLLESGTGIAPASLRRDGTLATWRTDGAARSAPM